MAQMSFGTGTRFSSGAEAAECGRRGGIRSGEVRRQRRMLAEAARAVLSMPLEAGDLSEMQDLRACADANLTVAEASAVAIARKALAGDVEAARFLRDTSGEKPNDRVEVSADVAEASKDIRRMIEAAKERDARRP